MDKKFDKSVADAEIVLAYASENGIIGDQEKSMVDAIMHAKYQSEAPSSELESQFWLAYSKLTAKIRPASVESIIAVEGDGRVGKRSWFRSDLSEARRTIRFYQRLGFFFMFFMLTAQIYWIIGAGFMTDIRSIPVEREKLILEKFSRQEILGDKAAYDLQIQFLEARITNLEDKLESSSNGLQRWFYIWQKLALFGQAPLADVDPDAAAIRRANRIVRYSPFVLEAIQSYVLPIFYGLLGAFAFVLRRLSREIGDKTFTHESKVNYVLRIHLGALAGLAVGWFLGGSESSSPVNIASLSPLALAFLTGYSVDLLFAAMDRIIDAISSAGKSAKERKAESEKSETQETSLI